MATRWRQTLSHAGRLLLRTVISLPAGGLPRPAPFNAAASGCKGASGQAEGQSQICHVPMRKHLQETQGGCCSLTFSLSLAGSRKLTSPRKVVLAEKHPTLLLLTGFHLDSVSPAVTLFLS